MTFVNKRKSPQAYNPTSHVFSVSGREDHKGYDGSLAVARLRGSPDLAVWVVVEKVRLKDTLDTTPIEPIEVTSISDPPRDWIMVKRGDGKMVSRLTTSEDERKRRRVLRRISRQLRKKRKLMKQQVVR